MKTLILSVLVLISLNATAQSKYVNGTGFNSFFQKTKEAKLEGKTTGRMIFKYSEGADTIIFNDNGTLVITPDKNEVYDVSTKKYISQASKSEVKVTYSTYALANSIEIEINNQHHKLSLIDGGCDLVIPGLKWRYIDEDKTEKLLLFFTDDSGIYHSSMKTPYSLTVKAGSWIEWSISK
ncbi:hypothetical protein EYV94_26745 [Puteibacter caeruleilacunae]|nr:hypothetical protein EYV94_26745 [Puteibacter caeruleilacunae]